mgnify:FL=1
MRPVLIVAPPYNRLDSHVKALHLLCHYLNEAGAEAYLTTEVMNPNLSTVHSWKAPYNAITVYPESVSGHPYGTPRYARWILGTRRKTGNEWLDDERVFIFSNRYRDLAEPLTSKPLNVLWVPTFNYHEFCKPEGEDRLGYAVYMQDMSKLPDWYDPTFSTIIRKDRPISEREMVGLFQHSELFITDDVSTSMIDEARMCGCPVWVTSGLAPGDNYGAIEYGDAGVCFSEDDIALAVKGVGSFRKQYLDYTKNLGSMLRRFMEVMNDLS